MSKDNIQFKMQGLEETIKAFQLIEDAAFKKREVKKAERKAGKIYLNVVKAYAGRIIHDDGELEESFGIIRDSGRGSKDWISVKYGARVKGKHKAKVKRKNSSGSKRANTYYSGGWLAGIYEGGTKDRKTNKGHRTGKIDKTKFQSRSFKRTKPQSQRVLKVELLKGLTKAKDKARAKGMKFRV